MISEWTEGSAPQGIFSEIMASVTVFSRLLEMPGQRKLLIELAGNPAGLPQIKSELDRRVSVGVPTHLDRRKGRAFPARVAITA